MFRIFIHLSYGLLTCALVFPWISMGRRNQLIQRWSRQLLGICSVSVAQHGAQAALGHAMVVANHVSWLDIFVINALHPCRFVAKSEIRQWPILGTLAYKAGTVFIARGDRRDLRHIFKGLVASLHLGERIAFFPEGTTAAQGALLPFHANLFEAAVDAKALVQPFALRYVDDAGRVHHAVDFLGEMSFAESLVDILSAPPIHAQLHCLAPLAADGAHRRELAQAAQAAIGAALSHQA